MASPRPSAQAVRPVTARTWQALAVTPQTPEDAISRRVSVYNNDLYHNSANDASSHIRTRPASPLSQPTSARPGTPDPKSAERLQQQRISTPSRLAASERANSGGSAGSTGSSSSSSPAPQQRGQLQQGTNERPGTAPVVGTYSPFRTSAIGVSLLAQQPQVQQQHLQNQGQRTPPRPTTAATGNLAFESPMVRQQVLRSFSGAVPMESSSGNSGLISATTCQGPMQDRPGKGTPAPTGGTRPSTPSFQPIALHARPATALAGPSPPTVGGFSIKATYNGADSPARLMPTATPPEGVSDGFIGAYPQPPSTAPAKASLQGPAAAMQQQNGSLASFGISAAAFVAPAPKTTATKAPRAATIGAAQEGNTALQAPTYTNLVAKASLSSKADLRRFLLAPGPADKPLCCKIVRSCGGLLKGTPQYTLLLEQEGSKTGVFLVAARKRNGGPGGTSYLLSVDQHDISRHSASYVGKLRANFLGTEFVCYDAGSKTHTGGTTRCELGAALYQTNVLGTKGPRKMTVLIPKLEPDGQQPLALCSKGSEHDTLLGQYKSYNPSSCVVLRNKPPRWNQSMGAYCLNFGGRVTQASVKNFQLVSVDNMERTILQFGKVADDVFTMDYSYPMTALQAFGICLSSFASKLACE